MLCSSSSLASRVRPHGHGVRPMHACRRQLACRVALDSTTQQSVNQLAAGLMASVLLAGGAGPALAGVAQTTYPGSNLGFLSNEEVQERRKAFGFTRAFDGKVALENREARTLWDVKLDLKSPGTLLLRSPEGTVYVLGYESLKQIDLSDDEVVGAIAASPWETGAKAVEAVDEENKVQKLELTREGFYELISVVDP